MRDYTLPVLLFVKVYVEQDIILQRTISSNAPYQPATIRIELAQDNESTYIGLNVKITARFRAE
ncbi:MAG: hypothetical protein Fur0021_34170 [Candidatus Promineifilaceae bacterium]